jgi:Toprim domain-containing protein
VAFTNGAGPVLRDYGDEARKIVGNGKRDRPSSPDKNANHPCRTARSDHTAAPRPDLRGGLDKRNRVGVDLAVLRSALAERAAEIAVTLLGESNRLLSNRRELRFGRKGSVAVVIAGAKAGCWYDHENGVGGDLLGLIRGVRGGSFREAITYALEIIGSAPIPASTRYASGSAPSDNLVSRSRASELWREAVPIGGTHAARYLEWRHVLEPALEADDSVLRFHPNCWFGKGVRQPCMLALMREIESNEPCAIQRIALTQSMMRAVSQMTFTEFAQAGNKVARMALGPKTGTAIKLSPDDEVTQELAIGEGLETVLAAMQLGFCPAWALGGTSGIRKFPVLSGIEALTILVDNDKNSAGQQAAQECSARWISANREVLRAVPNHAGDDFNDVLRWSLNR